MKRLVNKIIVSVLFLMFFISCKNKKQSEIMYKQEYRVNAQVTIFRFIKAITTLDTVLFYSTVDRDSIIASLKQLQKKDTTENINIGLLTDSIHKLYFFSYGPWKILPQNLKSLREREFTFKSYTMDIEEEGINYCKIKLYWKRTPNSDTSKINVEIRKNNDEWKITSALF